MTALTPEETDVLKRLLAALGDAGKEFIDQEAGEAPSGERAKARRRGSRFRR
jgi:hypothetical protein